MSNPLLREIQDEINNLILKIKKHNKIIVEIEVNDIGITYDFQFKFCLARLILCQDNYAPYRYVHFEALSLDTKVAKEKLIPALICFFADNEEYSLNDVMTCINLSLNFCEKYIPDLLEESYVNNFGYINTLEINKCFVHPDDVNGIQYVKDDIVYKCIGTEAQYLVVNADRFTIRITSNIFNIIQ